MSKFIPAIVAVVSLCAASAQACNPVAIVAPQQAFYAAPVVAQQFVAPVYQPVVQAVQVQQVAYADVQQVVVKQQRVRRHPVRRALQVVAPPYGCR